MKLNFWQVLGILLLVIGAAWWVYTNFIAAEEIEEEVPAEVIDDEVVDDEVTAE
ncbi:MAG: hypothetical protein AAF743_13650 [Planctomycetota bacterium]